MQVRFDGGLCVPEKYRLVWQVFMIDVNSDVAVGYDQYEALQLGTCTPRTGFLNGKWQNGYNAVQRANLAIRSIGEAPIAEDAKIKCWEKPVSYAR